MMEISILKNGESASDFAENYLDKKVRILNGEEITFIEIVGENIIALDSNGEKYSYGATNYVFEEIEDSAQEPITSSAKFSVKNIDAKNWKVDVTKETPKRWPWVAGIFAAFSSGVSLGVLFSAEILDGIEKIFSIHLG